MPWVPGLKKRRRYLTRATCSRSRKLPEEIAPEIDMLILEKEVEPLRENYRVWVEKNYEVFIVPTSDIPHIIREIGRLREVTFREIGEGTNKSVDLDEYDIYYHHLFIWDTEAKVIVGAYRIGLGDEIFYSLGKKGFYVAELFKIKEQFTPVLKKSLELGRSFIRKEYQQKPLPLFLLVERHLKIPDR